jgi:hypothetical protein
LRFPALLPSDFRPEAHATRYDVGVPLKTVGVCSSRVVAPVPGPPRDLHYTSGRGTENSVVCTEQLAFLWQASGLRACLLRVVLLLFFFPRLRLAREIAEASHSAGGAEIPSRSARGARVFCRAGVGGHRWRMSGCKLWNARCQAAVLKVNASSPDGCRGGSRYRRSATPHSPHSRRAENDLGPDEKDSDPWPDRNSHVVSRFGSRRPSPEAGLWNFRTRGPGVAVNNLVSSVPLASGRRNCPHKGCTLVYTTHMSPSPARSAHAPMTKGFHLCLAPVPLLPLSC